MKEHAIPQDITGYKFHIVGNMTLKQFSETALGVVMAFFVYKTNLYFPIKWFLIAFFSAFGAALAFLPIQERPLDHWFITFFSILYKPTKFYWKRDIRIPEAFKYKSNDETKSQIDTIDLTPQKSERIREYLQSVQIETEKDQSEIYLQQRSSQLLSMFEDQSIKINYTRTEKIVRKPNLKVQVRSLIGINEDEPKSPQPLTSVETTVQVEQTLDITQQTKALEKQDQNYNPLSKDAIATSQVATRITIPKTDSIKTEEEHRKEQESIGEEAIKESHLNQEPTSFATDSGNNEAETNNIAAATTNKDLPFPTKPSIPNKLVGMTLTKENDLIDNATITLKDSNNSPVSSVRSNALGQFFISSRLVNGTYNINVKKEGFTFYPIQINLKGEIVEPLEIRSNE